jgi:hypothetical protein
MKTYLIQYQLPEEAPDTKGVKAKSEDDAIHKLRQVLGKELEDSYMDAEEINGILKELSILEIQIIK